VALLIQVVSAGVKAFKTYKEADGEKWSQKAAWTAEPEGILTLLVRHEAFEDVPPESMPKCTSVLQTIKRLLVPTTRPGTIEIDAHAHHAAACGRARITDSPCVTLPFAAMRLLELLSHTCQPAFCVSCVHRNKLTCTARARSRARRTDSMSPRN
jgi:hypothetical protein